MNINAIVDYFKNLNERAPVEVNAEFEGSVSIYSIKSGTFSAEVQIEGTLVAVLTRYHRGLDSLTSLEGQKDATEFVLSCINKSIDENGYGF